MLTRKGEHFYLQANIVVIPVLGLRVPKRPDEDLALWARSASLRGVRLLVDLV